ncbi:MAG TPA: A/G-specific adenine glycosylase, partial [Acinetobacter sp.]|nr:A/G-specific adenine glycosylase [Acinetobacter sp.]
DQQEHLAIELQGFWMNPETAVNAGIPTAMKKLISTVNL